jgi:purine-cytosine permease-like protein
MTQQRTPESTPHADVGAATKETLEDYTLRFAPRSYRRWSTGVVGVTALGGIAYLADFAIGANIGISYGTTNALWGILVFAVVIVLTGIPLAYYAARYNMELDLITRGSGFGYYGSVVTNVIYATFTFIFFALEGSIMAQGLNLGLGLPLWIGYAVSTIIIFPLVVYGMKVLSKLQLWTTPLWLLLMVAPFAYLLISHPESVVTFFAYQGENGRGTPSLGSTMLAAGVCLSLIAQIAEQIDYLRFMPPRTPLNARRWWTAVLLAGPGWVVFGAIKQVVGLFLAVYIIANVADGAAIANQPVHQFLEIYRDIMPGWLAMTTAVVLVVISQIKINVTNAYSGSVAWTNAFTRLTGHYPGRLVFLAVNLLIALVLMEANMFDFLNTILGFYANCGMSWVVVVATDIVVNKYLLKLSPMAPEFRRGMLYAINPVGFGSMIVSAGLSIVAFFGGLGAGVQPFSPLVAIGLAVVLPPVLAVATRGRYYLRRADDGIDLPMYDEYGNPSGTHLNCHVCGVDYERPDMTACAAHGAHVCSLCLSTDKTGEHVLPAQSAPAPTTTAPTTT